MPNSLIIHADESKLIMMILSQHRQTHDTDTDTHTSIHTHTTQARHTTQTTHNPQTETLTHKTQTRQTHDAQPTHTHDKNTTHITSSHIYHTTPHNRSHPCTIICVWWYEVIRWMIDTLLQPVCVSVCLVVCGCVCLFLVSACLPTHFPIVQYFNRRL